MVSDAFVALILFAVLILVLNVTFRRTDGHGATATSRIALRDCLRQDGPQLIALSTHCGEMDGGNLARLCAGAEMERKSQNSFSYPTLRRYRACVNCGTKLYVGG
jgi:hypothetical protein